MTPELIIKKLKDYCTYRSERSFEKIYGQTATSARYLEGKADTYCEILKVIEIYEGSNCDE